MGHSTNLKIILLREIKKVTNFSTERVYIVLKLLLAYHENKVSVTTNSSYILLHFDQFVWAMGEAWYNSKQPLSLLYHTMTLKTIKIKAHLFYESLKVGAGLQDSWSRAKASHAYQQQQY